MFSQSFRILLVEDDDSLRDCLSDFLGDHGWVVAATPDSDEAVALNRRHRFDFSILDYHLPGTTGLDLFGKLHTQRPMPAILISGLASNEEVLAARDAGFFRFVRKPLELGALRGAVEQLIRAHFGGPITPLPSPSPASKAPRARPRHGI